MSSIENRQWIRKLINWEFYFKLILTQIAISML